jgi:DNA repair photolyase
LDILKRLNEHNLVSVAVSITTLDKKLQRILEPRTSIPQNRLKIIKTLNDNNIPVVTMMAPIIPGLTDHEILNLAKKCADAGSLSLGYSMLRLNYNLDKLFIEWLNAHMPDKKDKVINHIKNMRKGKLSATIRENRMGGYGNIAKIIKDQILLARRLYFPGVKELFLNTALHEKYKSPQLQLF